MTAARHLLVAAMLAAAACGTNSAVPPAPRPIVGALPTVAAVPSVPGADNPAVTQANIDRTICVRGWTATIRPPASFTDRVKVAQIAAQHLPGKPKDYELDHLTPLELGGSPDSPANLWPQPIKEARLKDVAETRLKREVCAHTLTLAAARAQIVDPANWRRP